MTKLCNVCKEDKKIDSYYPKRDTKSGKYYPASLCKECDNKRSAIWQKNNKAKTKESNQRYYQKNKEKRQEYQKLWREKNQEKMQKYHRNWKMQKRYGITLEDYNKILAEQGYCCAICGGEQGEGDSRLNLDHCHETGRVRGILCSLCNTSLGGFRDNEELMLRAIYYLRNNSK